MNREDKNKKNNKELGNSGENTACLFLESKGYKIISQNYRANRREIDIIAQKGEYIIFAEVKTRSSVNFGTASQSVNIKKQRHIISAARLFLLKNFIYSELQPRFDIIEIYRDSKTGKDYVRHIEGAFITNNENSRG
ncbi:MAG: YraN family protein [Oscillospiraceae bacterium]|nr:YraN family protein [Oscillospiraceae bacterium]